jgi:hypothetical protein
MHFFPKRIKAMKKTVWIIAVFLLLVSGGVSYAVDVNIQTGLNFNWWDSTGAERGSQTYVPVSIYGEQSDFSAKILTAFVNTDSNTSGASSDSLSCNTDTKVNLSYMFVDSLPISCSGLILIFPPERPS